VRKMEDAGGDHSHSGIAERTCSALTA
jgi:hypothetical protein